MTFSKPHILRKRFFSMCWMPFLLAAASAAAQDITRHSLFHHGMERTYIVTVPLAVIVAGEPVPLVIALHGAGGDAVNAMRMTGFDRKAEEEGFIAAFPDGSGRTALKTWNATHCCGAFSLANRIDDVGFIAALIDELIARYPVDPARVYVTGMSNGAMMTHQLAIALPHKIAAIAPVVGALFGDESPPPLPVPAFIVNGALDRVIPPQGGPLTQAAALFAGAWDGTPLSPAAYQGQFWAAANGCEPEPAATRTAEFTLWQYDCPAGADVEYYLLGDGAHAWPGGMAGRAGADLPSDAMDATDRIWEFFQRFRKPMEDQ